jgi:hypothetical protein
MSSVAYLKTDNEVKLELHKPKPKQKFIQQIEQPTTEITQQSYNLPRYGTTVDLKTNKVTDQSDKYTTRDKNIKSTIKPKTFRISRLNVDSRYRNKDPKNIISNFIKTNGPIQFTQDSNILTINLPYSHGLNVDDNITISNFFPKTITLRANSLSLKKNSRYLFINHPNHGFSGKNNIINISGVINSDPLNSFFGNIPLSIINGEHIITLIDSNGITDYDNYKIDIGVYSNSDFIYAENNYDIDIMTYNGIHIKYLNASYPINYIVQQGYFTITESNPTNIKIMLNPNAIANNTNSINTNILIGNISSVVSGFPYPDYYKFNLKRNFYKVKKIRLVSTEIPNTEMLIKKAPANLKNNVLYWQIQEDGDYQYMIDIYPGNYDADSLKTELISKISNISRNFGPYLDSNLYEDKLIPVITINPSNNLFSIQINSKITLEKNISVNNSTFSDSYTRITVTHPYHNLNSGDQIIISNSINVLYSTLNGIKYYIPNDIINSTHIIESVTGINNYIIKLNKFNPTTTFINDATIYDGGNAVLIIFPLTIRLQFNFKDTIGSILGFKNTGEEMSITVFNKVITNQTNYLNDSDLNSVGLFDENVPILNFRTYPYILMVSELFSSNINYKDSTGVFAKLFLTGNPGSIIYDQYIQITEKLPTSISSINSLEFKFLTPDGIPYNFNGQDHSYTIEIYEESDENPDIKLSL